MLEQFSFNMNHKLDKMFQGVADYQKSPQT
jgi:hypothetical protein